MDDLKVAVIGAGVIGRTHIDTLSNTKGLSLSAIVDPTPAARELAGACQVRYFADAGDLLDARICDAVVIASPNDTHVAIAELMLGAGLPVLLEKPVASSLPQGAALAAAVARSGVPLLVGHHRRHNPLIKAAKQAISEGAIGPLVMATVTCAMLKPMDYFDVAWRRDPDQGGPLLINAIHDIDLLRHFFGEVSTVQGTASNKTRGLEVEDTTAAILSFEDSGLATVTLSDAAVGPWAWELSSGENPGRFPKHDTTTHLYAGRDGGLSLPDLSLWTYGPGGDWTHRLNHRALARGTGDTYLAQMEHFGAVIRGEAEPLVTCLDGIRNMHVVAAIKRSSATGRTVDLSELAQQEAVA
ncbi:MAG: Gfo/Idh/MocA family oxidoreductase [Thalassobaculaceae bacterium]|nr:Gfo/Idh/MocA family oxidoreductase [Thalassobaculaceae bacterium]